MALSVAVHKDISEYQPKIIGKMTARSLISITGACTASVAAALYMNFVLGLDPTRYMMVIYAVSIPFWLMGFIRPHGMPFEQFFPLWLRAYFTHDCIFFKPAIVLDGLAVNSGIKSRKGKIYGRIYRRQQKLAGIEAYSPRAGRVIL